MSNPTPERIAKAGEDGEIEGWSGAAKKKGETTRYRLHDVAPIIRMQHRKIITDQQFNAAQTLYRDWYIAGQAPRITGKYGIAVPAGGDGLSERAIESRQRIKEARDFVGAKLYRIIELIVLEERNAYDAGRLLFPDRGERTQQTSTIDLLKLALDALTEYYARQVSRNG